MKSDIEVFFVQQVFEQSILADFSNIPQVWTCWHWRYYGSWNITASISLLEMTPFVKGIFFHHLNPNIPDPIANFRLWFCGGDTNHNSTWDVCKATTGHMMKLMGMKQIVYYLVGMRWRRTCRVVNRGGQIWRVLEIAANIPSFLDICSLEVCKKELHQETVDLIPPLHDHKNRPLDMEQENLEWGSILTVFWPTVEYLHGVQGMLQVENKSFILGSIGLFNKVQEQVLQFKLWQPWNIWMARPNESSRSVIAVDRRIPLCMERKSGSWNTSLRDVSDWRQLCKSSHVLWFSNSIVNQSTGYTAVSSLSVLSG